MAAIGPSPERVLDPALWEAIREDVFAEVNRIFARAFWLGWILATAEIDAALGRKDFTDDLIARARATLAETIQADIEDIGDPRTPVADWPQLQDWVAQVYTSSWWDRWSNDERWALQQVLLTQSLPGKRPEELAEALAGRFGRRRAEVIASTEMTNVMGLANQTAYRRAGFQRWEWRTAADRRVDPICQALDGETFPIDVAFVAAHPRCRCWPVPVPDSLPGGQPRGARPTVAAGEEGLYADDFPLEWRRSAEAGPVPERGFRTALEASTWFRKRYPWIEPAFGGLDPQLLTEALRIFDDLAGRFPWVAGRMTQFRGGSLPEAGRMRPNNVAYALLNGRGIGLNRRWWGKTGEMTSRMKPPAPLRTYREGRWSVRATDSEAGSTIAHEFGHLVDGYLINEQWDVVQGRNVYRTPGLDVDTEPSRLYNGEIRQQTKVSEYGTRNVAESMAEAFAEWYAVETGRLPASEAHPHALALGKLFEAYPPRDWRPTAWITPRGQPSTTYRQTIREVSDLMRKARDADGREK